MKDLDPKYTEKCSLQTVCDPEKGFFVEFLGCVKESCGSKWIESDFAKLSSNEERLKSAFDIPEVLGTLEHVSPVFKEKSQRISVQRRLEGDIAAKAGNYQQALLLYSQSVIRAPEVTDPAVDDGLTLAKALWSRSAVLVALGKGELALNDLKYSQDMGITIKDNPDFYWRMGQCYSLMHDKKRAEIAFNVTEKMLIGRPSLLDKLKLDQEKAKELPDQVEDSDESRFNLAKGENKELKGVSQLVVDTSAPGKGRFLIAGEAITVGDNLIVEDPVASVLLSKFSGSHCHHCLKRVEAPVGCSTCCGIAFCSLKCKKEAQYHRFECELLDLIVGSGMSVLAQLTLRLVTSRLNPDQALIDNDTVLKSLLTHSQDRSAGDYLNRTIMCAFLLRILQKGGFFGRRTTEGVDPSAKEIAVGVQMLDMLQALQFNAHEIYETVEGEEHPVNGSKMNYIGVAIYKSAALCNHECFPALARYFVGRRLVLTALRNIDAGLPICENYGPTFIKYPLKDRKRMLMSRYWFECDCMACKEDWPVLQHLINKPRLRCPSPGCENVLRYPDCPKKRVKCVKCGQMVSLFEQCSGVKECEILYKTAAKEMKEKRLEEAILLFEDALKRFHHVACPPHKDTHLALESLRVCYGHRGNIVKRVQN